MRKLILLFSLIFACGSEPPPIINTTLGKNRIIELRLEFTGAGEDSIYTFEWNDLDERPDGVNVGIGAGGIVACKIMRFTWLKSAVQDSPHIRFTPEPSNFEITRADSFFDIDFTQPFGSRQNPGHVSFGFKITGERE